MTTFNLPNDHRPYADKYFLRSKEILEKEELNPVVKLQVFVRKGICQIFGIEEAIAILTKYSDIEKTGHVYALPEGAPIGNCETVMLIEAPIQSIIDLETMYLGVISAETTLRNGGKDVNLASIEATMQSIVDKVPGRPVMYFGARHWRYDRDMEIAEACFKGGASDCSTDAGAANVSKLGVGTIPHALEAVYHWKCGIDHAVMGSVLAFNKYIDKDVPRIALVDYANKEVLDSLAVAIELDGECGIRIDTCGENWMEGVLPASDADRGVSERGVWLVRKILNDAGFNGVKIVLSSGFANPDKVERFVKFEQETGMKMFDSLGVGQVFEARCATGDIVEVEGMEVHKIGRPYKSNHRMVQVF